MNRSNRFLILIVLLAALALGAIGYVWTEASVDATRGSLRILERGFRVNLDPVHSSEAAGSATFHPSSDSVTVIIDLQDLRPDSQYNVHLHEGSCSGGGAGGVGLEAVRSDSQGVGASRTTLSLERLNPDRDHMVMVHRPNQHHALCGDAPSVDQLKSFTP